jgi:UDP-2-acetamido-2-deoxy-ribo-hexuluronate aminotransferase
MSGIQFVDLKAQYSELKSQIDQRIDDVLNHSAFIQGPEVRECEETLAKFARVGFAVGVASGTDALQIALMAENIGEGDAVYLPAFTFTATAEVLMSIGATPVFCDVDGRDFNIDCDHLEAQIKKVAAGGKLRSRAIIAVDLFGLPADYERLGKIAKSHGMFLLADGAQSFGAHYQGGRVGALASATALSFFPAKPLGCYGDGGAILTDDGDRAARYRSIGAHGKGDKKYDIVRIGLNSRLDTIQAAILLAKLTRFEEELRARDELSQFYDTHLADIVEIPFRHNNRQSAWAQYGILLDNRDDVAAKLKTEGIPTAIYYPRPMHLQSAYKEFGHGKGSLPVSELLSKRILHLPMHAYMAKEERDEIVRAIKRVCQRS